MTGEYELFNRPEMTTFRNSVRGIFSTGSEYKDFTEDNIEYRRKILDYRIEAFLDRHFHDYLHDFGILDEAGLEVRNESLLVLEDRCDGLISFIKDADHEVTDLERRVDDLEKSLKKK